MEIKKNKQEIVNELNSQVKDLRNYGGGVLNDMCYMVLGKITTLNDLGILTNKECATWVNTLSNMQIKIFKEKEGELQ